MAIKPSSSIAAILLIVINSVTFKTLQAQGITIVPNPDSGSVQAPFMTFNNDLYFGYSNASGAYLSKYNGSGITTIPNAFDGRYNSVMAVLNQQLIFNYSTPPSASPSNLVQYDGTAETLIPDVGLASFDFGYRSPFLIWNNALYSIYQSYTYTHEWYLAKYDGANVTLVTSPMGTAWGPYYPTLFHNNLYAEIITNGEQLAKVNADNAIQLFPNPDAGFGLVTPPMIYNDQLFFVYENASRFIQLAAFDGTSVKLVPNTNMGNQDNFSVFFGIVYNNKLYIEYWSQATGITQLVQFDGTALTFIPNPDAGSLPFENNSSFVIYNSKLYFQYKNAAGIYQLAQFDGASITLIPNPDNGLGFNAVYDVQPVVHNNKLYINYENTSNVNHLAEFDGNSLTLIPNPEADASLDKFKGYLGYPVIYADKLFFIYRGASGFEHLAYLSELLPVTFLDFYAQLKNSNVMLQWQTSMEENSNRFVIQRSEDGINFNDIGIVKATGHSASIETYNYTDASVIKLSTAKLFYRLEEVDNDGKMQLSKVVSIALNYSSDQIAIYPTPAHGIINIDLPAQFFQDVLIVLYDRYGKMVMQQKNAANSLHRQIHINNLAGGIYTLAAMRNGKKIFAKQVLVTH